MSIAALGYAFSVTLPANEKWLLVCLADYADEWGDSVFPALETLEAKAGMSRSTLRRTFRELLKLGRLVRLSESTPVSPAFYRIVGIPEPKDFEKVPSCPAVLRRAVIFAFDMRCEYCHRASESKDLDPDGKPWQIDRLLPTQRGGIYSPDNVTLACRVCLTKRRTSAAPFGTRTFSMLQAGGRQVDPSPDDTPEASSCDPGGVRLDPDPCIDPITDPSVKEKAGASPRPPAAPPENAEDNLNVITRLAHEAFNVLGRQADLLDISEAVKGRCAKLKIAYRGDVVRKAVESAAWQRHHAEGRA